MYPPPYGGSYATPWLWVDGRQRGYQYNLWAGYVSQRVTVPTPVSIGIFGEYNQGSRTGTVQAVIQNDSSAAITARVSVVITEDSCYYAGPNGDPWHNHVCRDYIPDQNGTIVTVPAGGADTVELAFAIQSGWREEKCKLVVYAQSTTMVPSDSSYPAYQGATVPVLSLVGIGEAGRAAEVSSLDLKAVSNPDRGNGEVRYYVPAGVHYRLSLFSPDGRCVREACGVGAGKGRVRWNGLRRGVYVCQLAAGAATATEKLVIGD